MGAAAGIGTFLKSLLVVFGALILTNVRLDIWLRPTSPRQYRLMCQAVGWPPSGPWCHRAIWTAPPRLDVVGAVTVTAATGSFIYGMLNAGEEGWTDLGTLLPSGAAIVLYGVFVLVERTVPAPLMRLNLLARCPIAVGAF